MRWQDIDQQVCSVARALADRPARFEYRLTPKGIDLYPVPEPGLNAAVAAGAGMYVALSEAGPVWDSLPPLLRTGLPA